VSSGFRRVGGGGGWDFKGAHVTAASDAAKKEVLRRAGIGCVEVAAGDIPAELQRVVGGLAAELPFSGLISVVSPDFAVFANLMNSASLLPCSYSGASRGGE
jgi:hypothetical protein